MSCDVEDIIYVVQYANCKLEYIGETGNLRDRVRVHKSQIKHEEYSLLKMSKHIRECNNNNVEIKFYIMPLLKLMSGCEFTRRAKEDYFKKTFKPALN